MPIATLFRCILAFALATTAAAQNRPEYAIVIHGGAGSSPAQLSDKHNAARRAGLKRALDKGVAILKKGGPSMDAVEAVIRVLEDDPVFNAGKGAVLNAVGKCELDASIMDGSNKACGAVAGATTAKNPISLARKVMEKTRHVLLGGAGADAFAVEMGVERAQPEYFVTKEQRARWERSNRKPNASIPLLDARRMGTVGCVALDRDGNLAAGTSTGGLINKRFGRIGDSPIVGAGTYADNQTCGVSCTGVGEEFIRNAIAFDVSAQMKHGGKTVAAAVDHALTKVLKPGSGGIIALDAKGTIAIQYSTNGMASAAADSTGRYEINWGKEKKD